MDYTVNLKFKVDKKEVDKIGKDISKGVDLSGTGGSSTPSKQAKKKDESGLSKLGTFMTGMLKIVGPILGIAGILVLIADILSPIAAILTTMLTVVLYPFLKILLAFLKPAAISLMKFFGAKKSDMSAIQTGLKESVSDTGLGTMTGDFLSGLGTKYEELSKKSTLLADVFAFLAGLVTPLVFAWDLLKSVIYAVVKAFVWIWTFAVEVGKNIGAWLSQAGAFIVEAVTTAFEWAKNIGMKIWTEILQPAFNWFLGVGLKIYTDILKPAFEWFLDVGQKIYDDILKPAFDWFMGVGQKIYDDILKPAWDWFIGIGQKIWDDILKPAWDWFKDIGTKIWNIIKSPFDWLAGKIRTLWSLFSKPKDTDSTKGSHAWGATIPADGKYMLHAGETVLPAGSARNTSGPGNVTVNINIAGNADKMTVDYMITQLKKELGRAVNI